MKAALRLLAPLLCLLAIPAFAEPLTRQNFAAYFDTPKGAHIAKRYTNGKPKVEGTFILRRNRVMPHGVVQIWYPSGKLYQRYDPARNILTTWYPGGTIQREKRAPLELGGSYTQTRFYLSGQMRERIVERFNDTHLKQRLEFYYPFEAQAEGTPANRLSSLRRSEHIQFQIKEGWHPNGKPHLVARYDAKAAVGQSTTWRYYDAQGTELPSTRYFYRVNRSSEGSSGWIKEGLHLEYHDNGQLSSRIEYQNNLKHGRVQHFTDTGQIVLDGVYKRGELRGGTRTIWNAKGQIKGWEDGGAAMTFDDAGGLKSHAHRFGSGEFMVVYDGTGVITLENIRLPNSQARHLFNPKNPHSPPTASRYMGELRNNRPFGRWTVLRADDAKVIDIGFDDRGRLSGPAKQWFPKGQMAVDCTFEAGQPHGLLRTWYADGTKALEAVMVKGQTIGPYATWYPNGRPKEREVRSATGQRILGKWNAEGQAEVLEVHDPEKRRDVTSRMNAGVVTSREYRYPGRKTIDSDQYDARGKLRARTEYIDDDPKHLMHREYWPNGQLMSRCRYRDQHGEGVFETWFPSGQPMRRMRVDRKGTQGVVKQWSADGSPLPDTHFIDGIEQITSKAEPCFCNKAAKRPRRFLQPASRLIDLGALRAAQPGLQLQGYDETFLRWTGNYDALSGTLLSAVPLVAEIAGATLVLNPCRHGTNLSEIEMSMRSDRRGQMSTCTWAPSALSFRRC